MGLQISRFSAPAPTSLALPGPVLQALGLPHPQLVLEEVLAPPIKSLQLKMFPCRDQKRSFERKSFQKETSLESWGQSCRPQMSPWFSTKAKIATHCRNADSRCQPQTNRFKPKRNGWDKPKPWLPLHEVGATSKPIWYASSRPSSHKLEWKEASYQVKWKKNS